MNTASIELDPKLVLQSHLTHVTMRNAQYEKEQIGVGRYHVISVSAVVDYMMEMEKEIERLKDEQVTTLKELSLARLREKDLLNKNDAKDNQLFEAAGMLAVGVAIAQRVPRLLYPKLRRWAEDTGALTVEKSGLA